MSQGLASLLRGRNFWGWDVQYISKELMKSGENMAYEDESPTLGSQGEGA
jgi:hypothetical protein